ncbi:MAG: ribonuclease J [Desulfobacteraceae bacterium]|nr:ribonuclease J [Desulfobacteraceae bacterium]MBC2757335.1 ribonuclease J [Desulfobacteraceae bacterium]MBC2763951.1 ribonuclease J [ANME-2 cluster archaeon]
MLKIIPIGGLGEIGLNMMVFEYEDTIVIIDAGLMFPEDYMLGVDYVIPDMDYIRKNKDKVAGIILTHAHEDHIGALPYLLKEVNIPVYATGFTIGMLRRKIEEHDLLSVTYLHEISPREKLQIPPFDFEFIRVNHSVVDGVGIVISTPVGRIVHTGDFKLSETEIPGMMTDIDTFERLGGEGVLALLSDSTNVEKDGRTISDEIVGETLRKIISNSKGRVIVALFASNIARIQQVVNIIKSGKRKIVFNGRSIELSVKTAMGLDMLHIPDGMEIDVDLIDQYSPDEILIMTTGSQGEPMSALTRMSTGMHKQIKVEKGDTVILSSKFIPGNEKAIAKIINDLFRKGADVIYEKISEIHVSGHAFRDELKEMINLTMPDYFIPIHGEYRHLFHHAKLAEEVGIPKDQVLLVENGQIIEFDEHGGRINGNISTSRILVDGKGIGDVGRLVLKERRLLSEEGLVVVTIALDEETGFIVYGPEIASKGFVFEHETGHIIEDAKCVILEIIEDISIFDPTDRVEVLSKRLHRALREYFNFTIKRKPVILPFIMEI